MNFRTTTGLSASAIALVLALSLPETALAQDGAGAAADTAEDAEQGVIVVTARRREENLLDVPVAVTALGENALRDAQASTLGDLEGAVPNLSIHLGDAQNAAVYIRGVGQIDSLAFADPGVGIYIDDVYLGRAQGAFLDVYDVARIEVLRGPQGTLYGRNTIGGAIKFVSAPLENRVAGKFEIGAGNYGQLTAKGSLNAPIINDRLLVKASFARIVRDGFATNLVNGEDDGDKSLWAGRLAVEFRPSETVNLRVNADISRDRPDTSRTPARATPVFGIPASSDPFEIEADFNTLSRLETRGVSAVLSVEATSELEIKSITAFRGMTYDTNLDLDATAFAFFGVYVEEDQDQFSQELQFNYTGDRLTATGGLFYFREHDGTLSGLYGPAIGLVTGSFNDQLNKSYAIYGQLGYAITDRIKATAGLRYTEEDKDFARTQKFFDPSISVPIDFTSPGLLVTDIDTSASFSSLSPKFGLDFQASDDLMVYVSASRGFKSGGFDGRANTAEGAVPYLPETMWSYEAGLKSSFADHRITASLAAFHNDYSNLQLSSFVADQQGNFSALFTNAGRATMNGLELELAARPATGLNLNANLAWLDSQYDEFVGPGGADISDQRKLVNAPRWSGGFGATYSLALGDAGDLKLGGNLSYRSKAYTVVSSSEELAQDAFALLDAFVRFESASGVWWLEAGGKNLTDKQAITHGFDLSDSLGYQLAYYNDPLTWTVSAGIRF